MQVCGVGAPLLFPTLRGFKKGWIRSDAPAGLALAAIAVPAQMATAHLAGMPEVTGLYAFVAGSLVFALLGRSAQLVVGADSTQIAPISGGRRLLPSRPLASPATPTSSSFASLMVEALSCIGRGRVSVGVDRTSPFDPGHHRRPRGNWGGDSRAPTPCHPGYIRRGNEHDWSTAHDRRTDWSFEWVVRRDRCRSPRHDRGFRPSGPSSPRRTCRGCRFDRGSGRTWPQVSRCGRPRPNPRGPTGVWGASLGILGRRSATRRSSAHHRFCVRRSNRPQPCGRRVRGCHLPRISTWTCSVIGAGSLAAGLSGSFAVDASPPTSQLAGDAGARSQLANLVAATVTLRWHLRRANCWKDPPEATLHATRSSSRRGFFGFASSDRYRASIGWSSL